MKKLIVAAFMSAVVCAQSAVFLGDPENTSFQKGNISGWTMFDGWGSYPVSGTSQSQSGSRIDPVIQVVSSHTFVGSAPPAPGTVLNPYYSLSPYDHGGYTFLRMQNGQSGQQQGIYQNVFLNAGETIYGWLAFDRNGVGTARVLVGLLDTLADTVVITRSSDQATWAQWSFTAASAGIHRVSYSIINVTSGWVMFDMSAVPEPRGWLMGGALLGMLGVGEVMRRRRLQKQPAG